MENRRNRVVVKASRPYRIVSQGFLLLPILTLIYMIYAFRAEAAEPGSMISAVALVALTALPSLYFLLIYKNKQIEINNDVITVRNLIGHESQYSWDEITDAKIYRSILPHHGYAACRIISNGQIIAEVPVGFDGYFEMTYLLKKHQITIYDKRQAVKSSEMDIYLS